MQVVKGTVTNPKIAESPYYIWAKNNQEITNTLDQVLGSVWTGKTTAQKALTHAAPQLQSLLQGAYQ